MRKYFLVIAAVISLPILIPIDWCAFWTISKDMGFTIETGFISAYGFYTAPNGVSTYLGFLYTLAGMLPVVGSALIFVDVGINKRAISAIGGIVLIAGPIIWTTVHLANSSAIIDLESTLAGQNVIAGEISGTVTWSINWGFFFPIVAGMIGLFGAGGRK